MAIELKILFSGLVLICSNEPKTGENPFCEKDQALLVNAVHDRVVCDRKMDGGHYPKLSFDSRYLLPGSTHHYKKQPTPDGYWTIVAPLDGIELCIGLEDPATGAIEDLPGSNKVERDWQSWKVQQDHPKWHKADSTSFGWVPHLQFMYDKATTLHGEVKGNLKDNKYVVARVPLRTGVLKVPECTKSGGDYVLWGLNKRPPPDWHDFPKALPEKVLWSIPGIQGGDVIVLHTCKTETEPAQTLFRLRAGSKDLKLHISNDPEHEIHSMTGPALEHFRWFYHLVDWSSYPNGCKDAPVPAPPYPMVQAHEVEEAISHTIKCSPASAGWIPEDYQ